MKNFELALDKAFASYKANGRGVARVRGAVGTQIEATLLGWGVRYHATMVAWFPAPGIGGEGGETGYSEATRLDSGGFYTRTTAVRMNQSLALAGLDPFFRVVRRKGNFVLTRTVLGKTENEVFEDGKMFI